MVYLPAFPGLFFLKTTVKNTAVITAHTVSDTNGESQIPISPSAATRVPKAPARNASPLPAEIRNENTGFSTAVKYPADTTLNPKNRKDKE